MKIIIIAACALVAVLAFTGQLRFDVSGFAESAPTPRAAVGGVNDALDNAFEAGQPAEAGTPEAKLNAQCALRERRLSSLRRPHSLTETRAHALRVLAVLQAHSRRAAEPAEVRALDLEQQRIIQRLARAAGLGNYKAAQAESLTLRELAGRANATFIRLRLTDCLMRPSAIPL